MTSWLGDGLLHTLPAILAGLGTSLLIVAAALILGGAAGLSIGLMQASGGAAGRFLATGWSVLFRAIPMLLLMILIHQGLPFAGIRPSAVTSAILALALGFSAATAEALRLGIASIPRGQAETARLLGVGEQAILTDILVPQAIRAALPRQAENVVQLARDGALAAAIAVPDLLSRAREAALLSGDPAPLLVAAAIYLVLLIPARVAADRLATPP